MPIFSLLIAGEPVIAVAASDYPRALGFAADPFIRSELTDLTHPDGRPLLENGTDITVRHAFPKEQAIWETDVQKGIRDGDIDCRADAYDDLWFTFLIPYEDPL